MEATLRHTLQFATWIDTDKLGRNTGCCFKFYSRPRAHKRLLVFSSGHLRHDFTCSSPKHVSLKVASHPSRQSAEVYGIGNTFKSGESCQIIYGFASALITGDNFQLDRFVWQPESFPATFDEVKILKHKSEEIEPYLDGRCIYLVGMMGSGKTTVGKTLSESLGYSFFDCDTLIEQSVGGVPVKEIFKLHGERFFRDNETEVLHKLSSMHRLVVSTGGGAVVRPINWKYMHKGISVWLDVPLEALARRVAADGTQKRPLLHQESGDAYSTAFTRLTTLLEERGQAYENANARVCFEHIAAKLGYMDVINLTPTVIAIEALEQIERFVKR